MDSDTMQAFQTEFTCHMCMKYFIDPVTVDCGHNFCSPCLYLFWEDIQASICSPKCRETSKKPDFKTYNILKKLAVLARKTRPCPKQSYKAQICGTHKEAKEFSVRLTRTCSVGSALSSQMVWVTVTGHWNGLLRNTGRNF